MKRSFITLAILLVLVPFLGLRASADYQYIGTSSDYSGSVSLYDPYSVSDISTSKEVSYNIDASSSLNYQIASVKGSRVYFRFSEVTMTYSGSSGVTQALSSGDKFYITAQMPYYITRSSYTNTADFQNSDTALTWHNVPTISAARPTVSGTEYPLDALVRSGSGWSYLFDSMENAIIFRFYVEFTALSDCNVTIENGYTLTLVSDSGGMTQGQLGLYNSGQDATVSAVRSVVWQSGNYPLSIITSDTVPFTGSEVIPTPAPTETPTEESSEDASPGSVDLSTIENNQDQQTGLLQSIYNGVTGLLQSIDDDLSELSEAVQYGWSQLGQMLATTAATIVNGINAVQGWITSAASSITSAISNIQGWITSAASSITSAISGLADSIIGDPYSMWVTVTDSDLYESLSGFESFSDDFVQDVIDIYNVDPSFIITIPAFSVALSSGTHQIWPERTYDCGAFIESVPGLLSIIHTVVDLVVILAAIKYVMICIERIRIVISGGALGKEVDALRYLKD